MDPISLLSMVMIASGLKLASASGKAKSAMVKTGDQAVAKNGIGKGLFLPDIYWLEAPGSQQYKKGKHPYKQGKPLKWEKLIAARDLGVVGAILKASDGLGDKPNEDFFVREWKRLREAGGSRYGVSWFRGAYHYIRAGVNGAKQADRYLKVVDKAGGWDDGDMLPMVDVERSGPYNEHGTVDDFVRSVEQWNDRIITVTGRETIHYGRSVSNEAHEDGLSPTMGSKFAWNPSWTNRMHMYRGGFDRRHVCLWQYTNGETNLTNFMTSIPGFIKTDMNVFLGRVKEEMMSLDAFREVMVLGES